MPNDDDRYETWDDRREYEIKTSYEPGRAPIAGITKEEIWFRPWEVLLGVRVGADLVDALRERCRAVFYEPNPEDPTDWRAHSPGTRGERGNINERLRDVGAGVRLYVLPRETDPTHVVDVVRTLRKEFPPESDPEYGIHLDHVLFAAQI